MQKVVDVIMHCVYTDEDLGHLLLEYVRTVSQTHRESFILLLNQLGDDCAKFF